MLDTPCLTLFIDHSRGEHPRQETPSVKNTTRYPSDQAIDNGHVSLEDDDEEEENNRFG